MDTLINLKELPSDIYKQIPLSLRAYSNEYRLSELPVDIQQLIQNYVSNAVDLQYKIIYDVYPSISKYGDLAVFKSKKQLIIEYLKNYLLTLPNDYPFDPLFGSYLRKHIQTKDTALRKLLIDQEIQNIVAVLATDLSVNIQVQNIVINIKNQGLYAQYDIQIDLLVDEEQVSITTSMQF